MTLKKKNYLNSRYDFGMALGALRNGVRVRRFRWNDSTAYLQLSPGFVIEYCDPSHSADWVPTQEDVLANDWEDAQ